VPFYLHPIKLSCYSSLLSCWHCSVCTTRKDEDLSYQQRQQYCVTEPSCSSWGNHWFVCIACKINPVILTYPWLDIHTGRTREVVFCLGWGRHFFLLPVCLFNVALCFYRDVAADGQTAAAEVHTVSDIRAPYRSVANCSETGWRDTAAAVWDQSDTR